jgi:outer membrane protein OmpA-like peptidoglycan-associated protein
VPVSTVVVKVPLVRAVEKVLAHNVPVLTGTPLISPILFGANSSKLDAGDVKQIIKAASLLKDKSGWLFVTGFVKYEGKGTAFEKKIANARATVVARQLAKLGLKVKIGYLGYGPQNKKSPNPTDRKVELRWLPEPTKSS